MGKQGSTAKDLIQIGMSMEKASVRIGMAKEILRIRDRNGRAVALAANRAQKMFERKRGHCNVVLKARQMGITTWVAGQFFLNAALQEGSNTLLVAHNREAAENIFGIVRRMWELLPEELQDGLLRLRRANASEIVFSGTGNEFRVASAADLNAGRGLSVQNLHCSEVSRWPGDAAETLAGLRAALAPGGELVLESTPNGAYGAFYDEWNAAVDYGSLEQGAVRHFFPWWLEPDYVGPRVEQERMTRDECALAERHGLSPAQIGFRRDLERSFGALRSQEFAEDAATCFRRTGSCCFEVEAIERRLEQLGEAAVRRRNGALLQWFEAVAGRRYVIAVDTAGGGAYGDFAAVQVVDVLTGIQCAELQERLRPAELAAMCEELSVEYGGALIAVERNNHGSAVLALLEMRPEVRLYRQSGQAGWLTSAMSKPEVVVRLGTLLHQSPERFFSRRLLGECRTFVTDERGRAGAAQGQHDDLVMAMAIAQAVRSEVFESELAALPARQKKTESFFQKGCV